MNPAESEVEDVSAGSSEEGIQAPEPDKLEAIPETERERERI